MSRQSRTTPGLDGIYLSSDHMGPATSHLIDHLKRHLDNLTNAGLTIRELLAASRPPRTVMDLLIELEPRAAVTIGGQHLTSRQLQHIIATKEPDIRDEAYILNTRAADVTGKIGNLTTINQACNVLAAHKAAWPWNIPARQAWIDTLDHLTEARPLDDTQIRTIARLIEKLNHTPDLGHLSEHTQTLIAASIWQDHPSRSRYGHAGKPLPNLVTQLLAHIDTHREVELILDQPITTLTGAALIALTGQVTSSELLETIYQAAAYDMSRPSRKLALPSRRRSRLSLIETIELRWNTIINAHCPDHITLPYITSNAGPESPYPQNNEAWPHYLHMISRSHPQARTVLLELQPDAPTDEQLLTMLNDPEQALDAYERYEPRLNTPQLLALAPHIATSSHYRVVDNYLQRINGHLTDPQIAEMPYTLVEQIAADPRSPYDHHTMTDTARQHLGRTLGPVLAEHPYLIDALGVLATTYSGTTSELAQTLSDITHVTHSNGT